ncbi:MAG: alpha/beta hydrolase [Rickettsiaceae bacterium H1]|nr:alpha/beta hydrolase [Rickettsiaceae bacterium H1]
MEKNFNYNSKVVTIKVASKKNRSKTVNVFSIYHCAKENKKDRPITFAFNGGPGGSSALLNFGGIGPERIQRKDDKKIIPPISLEKNPESWIEFTDLVFIDAPGTGYSVFNGEDGSSILENFTDFWGVQEDLEAFILFIKEFLIREERSRSPVFLCGESYGGLRVAALSSLLPKKDVHVNGAILVSPALSYQLLLTSNRFVSLLTPYLVTLPSYAATAYFHNKGSLVNESSAEAASKKMEEFVYEEALPKLALGDRFSEKSRKVLYSQIASMIGLTDDIVERNRGKITVDVFAKNLLKDENLIVTTFDSSITFVDFIPETDEYIDPYAGSSPEYTSFFYDYIRSIGFIPPLIPYKFLNFETEPKWNFSSGISDSGAGKQGFVSEIENFKLALTSSPGFGALIVHGLYDLATPWGGSNFALSQMYLDSRVKNNVSLSLFEGGHPFYLHNDASVKFKKLAQDFYQNQLQLIM